MIRFVRNYEEKELNPIPAYVKNVNKGLSAEDIKFYGKIHFSQDRSGNELNMHCHLIVSRKDQTNKNKLSHLTNYKNTQKETIKGGFDWKNLFQQTEQGFDKLFGYNRKLSETFEYSKAMKNGSITEKLRMQERQLNASEQDFAGEQIKENMQTGIYADKQEDLAESKFVNKQDSNPTDLGLASVFSILLSASNVNPMDEQQLPKPKKKRGRKI